MPDSFGTAMKIIPAIQRETITNADKIIQSKMSFNDLR